MLSAAVAGGDAGKGACCGPVLDGAYNDQFDPLWRWSVDEFPGLPIEDREDAIQDAFYYFARALARRSIRKLEGRPHDWNDEEVRKIAWAWLRTACYRIIHRRLARRLIAQRDQALGIANEPAIWEPNALEQIDTGERVELLLKLIDELFPAPGLCVVRLRLRHLSLSDIAKFWLSSKDAVKSRYTREIAKLRRALKPLRQQEVTGRR